MTNVAIAFPRNPIHLAHQAIRPAVADERAGSRWGSALRCGRRSRSGSARSSTGPWPGWRNWSRALRAIFTAWNSGERLDFRGHYYRHTLMTPTFSPRPNPYGPPPIYVGALGPRLTRATAEVADGLLVMPFGSKKFLHEATMPAVREGLAAAGRDGRRLRRRPGNHRLDRYRDDPDHAATRRLLAFYGSTPAYRKVLDVHGWGDLQPELNALSKQGRWEDMGRLIDDDMLHTIAACGSPGEIAAHIRDRVAGVSDRICVYQPGPIAVESLAEIVDALNG